MIGIRIFRISMVNYAQPQNRPSIILIYHVIPRANGRLKNFGGLEAILGVGLKGLVMDDGAVEAVDAFSLYHNRRLHVISGL